VIWNNVIVRLLLWYLAVLALFWAIMTVFPSVVELQLTERARDRKLNPPNPSMRATQPKYELCNRGRPAAGVSFAF